MIHPRACSHTPHPFPIPSIRHFPSAHYCCSAVCRAAPRRAAPCRAFAQLRGECADAAPVARAKACVRRTRDAGRLQRNGPGGNGAGVSCANRTARRRGRRRSARARRQRVRERARSDIAGGRRVKTMPGVGGFVGQLAPSETLTPPRLGMCSSGGRWERQSGLRASFVVLVCAGLGLARQPRQLRWPCRSSGPHHMHCLFVSGCLAWGSSCDVMHFTMRHGMVE